MTDKCVTCSLCIKFVWAKYSYHYSFHSISTPLLVSGVITETCLSLIKVPTCTQVVFQVAACKTKGTCLSILFCARIETEHLSLYHTRHTNTQSKALREQFIHKIFLLINQSKKEIWLEQFNFRTVISFY